MITARQIESLLPLGTVVQLRQAKHRLLIIGRLQTTPDKELYDYVGVPWPEGHITNEYKYLFNNVDIDEILFEGLQDEMESQFRDQLIQAADQGFLNSAVSSQSQ